MVCKVGHKQILRPSRHDSDATRSTSTACQAVPHGATDPRVAVWHSSKMAAALQAAGGRRPALLNIDFEAGHGRGSSTAQRLGTFADSIAFMLWQFGEPGFRPNSPN